MPLHVRLIASACLLTAALASSTLNPGSAVAAEPERRFAVLVGIADYAAPEVRRVANATNDAAELGKTLEGSGYVTKVLSGPEATKARILAAIQEVGKQAQPGDLFLFLFSGRAAQVGPTAYFLTQDCQPKDAASIRASALSAKELKAEIDRVRATRRLALFDVGGQSFANPALGAQFSLKEGFTRDASLVRRPDTPDPADVSLTVFGSSPGKPAYDHDKEKRGYFSFLVERALTGEAEADALDGGGRLTSLSLLRFLRTRLPEGTKDRPQGPQQPEVHVQGSGPDFLLVDPAAVAAKNAPQPLQEPVLPDAAPSAKFALVIGLGNYNSLPDLPSPASDAAAVTAYLTTEAGFPREQVLTVTDAQGGKPEFWEGVRKWLATVRDGSVVVLYAAGYGRRDGNEDFVLLPAADAYPDYAARTSPSIDQLLARLDRKKPERILAFLDLCRDAGGAGYRRDRSVRTSARADLFYACSENETARDLRESAGKGVFTDYLLKGLRGDPQALGRRRRVTYDSLRRYLQERVGGYVRQTYNAAQTPEAVNRLPEGAAPVAPKPVVVASSGRSESNRPPGIILPDPAPFFSLPRLERVALTGHTDIVRFLAFDASGTRAASASAKEICVWDVAEGRLLRTIAPPVGITLSSLALSPDGKTLAGAGSDFVVRLWNLDQGAKSADLSGHKGFVSCLAFSPDGRLLATGGWDSTVYLWDTANGQQVSGLGLHRGQINAVAFSPDGRSLATASSDETIRLWDTERWFPAVVTPLRGHKGAVRTVLFSPDGRFLASGGTDRTVRLWDPWTGKDLGVVAEMPNTVALIAFSANGERLAAASNNQARVWSLATDKSQDLGTLNGHNGIILTLSFAADNQTLATGEDDGDDSVVYLWDTTKAQKLLEPIKLFSPVWAVAFAPEARAFAAGTGTRSGNKVVLWRPKPAPKPPGR